MQSHMDPEQKLSTTSLPDQTGIPSTLSTPNDSFQISLGEFNPAIPQVYAMPRFHYPLMRLQPGQLNAANAGIFNNPNPHYSSDQMQNFLTYIHMFQQNALNAAQAVAPVLPPSALLETSSSSPVETTGTTRLPPTALARLSGVKRKPSKPRGPRLSKEKKSGEAVAGPKSKRQKNLTEAEKLQTRQTLVDTLALGEDKISVEGQLKAAEHKEKAAALTQRAMLELTAIREGKISAETRLQTAESKLEEQRLFWEQYTVHVQQQFSLLQTQLMMTKNELEEKNKRIAELERPPSSSFYAETDTSNTTPGSSNDSTPLAASRQYFAQFTTPPDATRNLRSGFESMPGTPILGANRLVPHSAQPLMPELRSSFPFLTSQHHIPDFYTHGGANPALFFSPPLPVRSVATVKREGDRKEQSGEHSPCTP
jgi:hypothetical protein